jgi:hypothetical protein
VGETKAGEFEALDAAGSQSADSGNINSRMTLTVLVCIFEQLSYSSFDRKC